MNPQPSNAQASDMNGHVLAALAAALCTGFAASSVVAGLAVAFGLLSIGFLARYVAGGVR